MRKQGKLNRRQFFQGTGALIVGFSATGISPVETLAGEPQGRFIPDYPAYDLTAVDSFIEVHSDGKVLVNIGKINNGQGTPTSWAMMAAEELDVPVESIELKFGDTAATPDQGGSGNSNGVQAEYEPLRQAAATARQELLKLASTNLGAPVSSLTVQNGLVSAASGGKSVTYAQLIGNKKFNLSFSATAPVKNPSQFKIIGKLNPERPEIAKIATATLDYAQDVRVPDMLHGRSVRPPIAGSTLVKIEAFQGGNPPGLVKVCSKGNYVGVVAKTEWQAIQASKTLKVTWKPPETPAFPNGYEAIYDYLMKTAPQDVATRPAGGNVDDALKSAAQVISATYYSSFQSHAALTPGCSVADVRDGGATIWFGGQKPYRVRKAIADLLGLPAGKVRVIFYQGPGSYGTSDADDAAAEAAWLSQQVGRPVRVQWMRDEGIAWDPKGPPLIAMMRAGIDADGKVIAWDYDARLLNGNQRNAGALVAGDTLIGQAMGYEPPNMTEHGLPGASYNFANKRATSKVVPSKWAYETGLRTAHFRDPNGPQTTFASEQFIDEIATVLKMDPIAFRLAYLDPATAARDINVIQQVQKAAGWVARPSPNNSNSNAVVVSGRGFAYGPRQASIVGTVAEVTVNRKTGQVRVTKFTSGLDAGLIVHQKNAAHAIEGNLLQSMSRALYEGVIFDSENVKAVDWVSYPTIDIKEIPEVKAFLINPDGKSPTGKFVPPSGVGEPTTKPTAAAIANAIFDATGVRVRRQPLNAKTVLAALKAEGKAL
jgi:CO/xanthine dehydrogenase Mo-binding subunit